MGFEYRISCPPERLHKLETFLRSAGGLPAAHNPEQLEFRFRPSTPDEMPDAMAVMEEGGVYFCDNRGMREKVDMLFRGIIDEALTLSDSSDSIVVTSL